MAPHPRPKRRRYRILNPHLRSAFREGRPALLHLRVDRGSLHLVVVSGDLTQRAKPGQFREAKAYLDTLPKPQLVVPGNHDVPLYNVFQRMLSPLRKYRHIVTSDLEPSYIDDEIAVVGVNTARALTWKRGSISARQVDAVVKKIGGLHETRREDRRDASSVRRARGPRRVEPREARVACDGVRQMRRRHPARGPPSPDAHLAFGPALPDPRPLRAHRAGRHRDLRARPRRGQQLQCAAHHARRRAHRALAWPTPPGSSSSAAASASATPPTAGTLS